MKLESSKIIVQKSQKEVFSALENVQNFEKLMPESINKFELLGSNGFLFALSGMPEISLEQKEKTPHNQIVMGAVNSKIPFTLRIELSEISPTQTQVQYFFEGNFNPMMAMMVKNPISKFIEVLATKTQNF